MRCVVCLEAFDFAAHEAALVLRHVAYGYDFVHDNACLADACERLFPEPGYDCGAFARDPKRQRVLAVMPADGWVAVVGRTPEPFAATRRLHSDPLLCWALVEYRDGSTSIEGLVRDKEWLDEPGGAEFPESLRGPQTLIGYASTTSLVSDPESNAAKLLNPRSELMARIVTLIPEHARGFRWS